MGSAGFLPARSAASAHRLWLVCGGVYYATTSIAALVALTLHSNASNLLACLIGSLMCGGVYGATTAIATFVAFTFHSAHQIRWLPASLVSSLGSTTSAGAHWHGSHCHFYCRARDSHRAQREWAPLGRCRAQEAWGSGVSRCSRSFRSNSLGSGPATRRCVCPASQQRARPDHAWPSTTSSRWPV